MNNELQSMFQAQQDFNNLFFDTEAMSQAERERLTMVFAASMQKEIGSLLEGINFRQHRLMDKDPVISKILHESVDSWRYILAIMNLWGITPADFADAFADRDLFLRMRHEKESVRWSGQPVLIVDVDDVVTPFRHDCTAWVKKHFPDQIDETNTAYYTISQEIFGKYIDDRQFKYQGVIQKYIDALNDLREQGIWIHLLTARPKDNLTVKYDTYAWLAKSGLEFDRISFSPEKYLWVARTDYYKQGRVLAAVDDSPKHAMEYASHGIECLVPVTQHNENMPAQNNIRMCYQVGDFKCRVEWLLQKQFQENHDG